MVEKRIWETRLMLVFGRGEKVWRFFEVFILEVSFADFDGELSLAATRLAQTAFSARTRDLGLFFF